MSDDADRLADEAARWLERERFDRAEAAIAEGLRLAPESTTLLRLSAELAYARDAFALASAQTDAVLAREPQDYAGRLLKSRIARATGALGDAEASLLDLLADHPADPHLLSEYALTCLHGGQIDKARKLAAEALRIDPACELALVALTAIDTLLEQPIERQAALKTLLEQNPGARHTLKLLIGAQLTQLDAGAQAASAQLVRAAPNDPYAIELARAVRFQNHWTMLPLKPLMRFGWGGAIALYVAGMLFFNLTRGVLPPPIHFALVMLWLCYVIYSWVWPPLLKRYLERQDR
jgi:tetratricopeptide (TPR) repeat protein